ncbi:MULTISPECIES: hypothetical protein [Actinosynnema]|uniref:hypothetical protein n=1 Tax=Actinosynnema TaxID=40566 RepID=UPI0020A2E886|nr:hypothetical protein [Actinosynnema pretiosum]MCP2099209.1 hypothetical protein [Actinosynnema pretiosum]
MQTHTTGFSALAELAALVSDDHPPGPANWDRVAECFSAWACAPGLRERVREDLRSLGPREEMRVVARSRETTTHFAWCLRDEPAEPFTFWLHEYKPQRDWRPGYADSVHNHRYHFCTVILSGGYLHERYRVRLAPEGTAISEVAPLRSADCRAGVSGTMLAHEFHRIPRAIDGTMTFLVKSRAVSPWSLSYDPGTGTSHRHVPVEARWEVLTGRL